MNDDRDVDARFREIIGAEFGPLGPARSASQAPQPPEPPPNSPRTGDDFNITAALDAAEPEDPSWARYSPEPMAPMRRPKGPVLTGIVLMGGGVLIALLALFGANFGRGVAWGGIIAAIVGLAMLLSSTPRRRDDPWDDGARL